MPGQEHQRQQDEPDPVTRPLLDAMRSPHGLRQQDDAPRQDLRPDGQGPLVDVELGRVQAGASGPVGATPSRSMQPGTWAR